MPTAAVLESQPAALGSARAYAQDWMLLQRGGEVGVGLHYLTAERSLADRPIHFTDVVMASLTGRLSLRGGREEIDASAQFLPKQPSDTDELFWQGAQIGARHSLREWLTVDIDVAGGPVLDRAGYWVSPTAGATARKQLHEVLLLQGHAAVGYAPFFFDDDRGAFWLVEALAHGEMIIRAPRGEAGMWLGFAFAVPLAHDGEYPGLGAMDPQVRADVHLGGVVSIARRWDIFLEGSVIDRGDLFDPRTTLPVLSGGFDQRVLTFGLTRRFGVDPRQSRRDW